MRVAYLRPEIQRKNLKGFQSILLSWLLLMDFWQTLGRASTRSAPPPHGGITLSERRGLALIHPCQGMSVAGRVPSWFVRWSSSPGARGSSSEEDSDLPQILEREEKPAGGGLPHRGGHLTQHIFSWGAEKYVYTSPSTCFLRCREALSPQPKGRRSELPVSCLRFQWICF